MIIQYNKSSSNNKNIEHGVKYTRGHTLTIEHQ